MRNRESNEKKNTDIVVQNFLKHVENDLAAAEEEDAPVLGVEVEEELHRELHLSRPVDHGLNVMKPAARCLVEGERLAALKALGEEVGVVADLLHDLKGGERRLGGVEDTLDLLRPKKLLVDINLSVREIGPHDQFGLGLEPRKLFLLLNPAGVVLVTLVFVCGVPAPAKDGLLLTTEEKRLNEDTKLLATGLANSLLLKGGLLVRGLDNIILKVVLELA